MRYKIVKTKYGFYLKEIATNKIIINGKNIEKDDSFVVKKYTAKYCGTIQDKNRELFHLFEVK